MTILNNREISIVTWSTILLIYLFRKKEVKHSFIQVIKSFFAIKIIASYFFAVLYTIIGIGILSHFNLWHISELKDTILWCVFTIIPTLMNLNQVEKNKDYFKEAVKENLKFSLIIEFIKDNYTFSLPIELVLVPITVIIGAMLAFSKYATSNKSVDSFLKKTFGLLGISTVAYAIYKALADPSDFFSAKTLSDFLLSPCLAFWFLPFIFVLSLFSSYETYFIQMGFQITDKKLLKYAKWNAVLLFNVNVNGFKRWKEYSNLYELKNKFEVSDSINEIYRLQRAEKNPPYVSPSLGWSPYSANKFLTNKEFKTHYYSKGFDNSWYARSNSLKLGEDFIYNTISYSIYGEDKIVKELELILNVDSLKDEKNSIQFFLYCIKDLYKKATNIELSLKMEKAILNINTEYQQLNDITISFEKTIRDKKTQKYNAIFKITHS